MINEATRNRAKGGWGEKNDPPIESWVNEFQTIKDRAGQKRRKKKVAQEPGGK